MIFNIRWKRLLQHMLFAGMIVLNVVGILAVVGLLAVWAHSIAGLIGLIVSLIASCIVLSGCLSYADEHIGRRW